MKVAAAIHPNKPLDDQNPIGAIAKVHGPVVDISCDRLPPMHQALSSAMDHETYIFEVYQHLDEHTVRAITLHQTSGLRRGMPVFDYLIERVKESALTLEATEEEWTQALIHWREHRSR